MVAEKWNSSAYAKTLVRRATRANLTDFDRFKVMVARKAVRFRPGPAATYISIATASPPPPPQALPNSWSTYAPTHAHTHTHTHPGVAPANHHFPAQVVSCTLHATLFVCSFVFFAPLLPCWWVSRGVLLATRWLTVWNRTPSHVNSSLAVASCVTPPGLLAAVDSPAVCDTVPYVSKSVVVLVPVCSTSP